MNGSEDDLNVTRLSNEEGANKAAMAVGHVAASRVPFAAASPPHLDELRSAADPAVVRRAANWLFMAQEDGNDLTAALPVLLEAWQRPVSQVAAADTMHLAFFVHGVRNQENLAALRAALAAAGLEERPEMKRPVQSCQTVLLERSGQVLAAASAGGAP